MGTQEFLFFIALILFGNAKADLSEDIEFLKTNVESIARQIMLQQFYTEERVRSEGNSGIKQIRLSTSGAKNYFQESFVGSSAIRMHDHSNTERTIGLAEFIGVLNGIEFRTRHNDYKLVMPHPTSDVYHDVAEIPFPPVPPEVLAKGSVAEQITEMREFFRAWKEQDTTYRDYTPYFKPVLCYLEGAWTIPKADIEDQFESMHQLDALSFGELMDKIRYTSYTGYKSLHEDLAFLPTKIMGLNKLASNISVPVYVQWNYRILCHPLKNDLPLARLRILEDVKSRLPSRINITDYEERREARYVLNPADEDEFQELPVDEAFLDELMAEIPGKDNYQGYLNDGGFDEAAADITTGEPKDVSRYHRWYRSKSKDAMGLTTVHRAFSDDGFYGAMTTQPNVAGMTYNKCITKRKVTTCTFLDQRWSYAVPLEIIYLTPLNNWNPYNIQHRGKADSEEGKLVTAGGRNGDCDTPGKEFDGSNCQYYYRTPAEFFIGGEVNQNGMRDTVLDKVCVLNTKGDKRETAASGTRIHFPEIPGLGILRQRYPIFPVHGEGNPIWKELNAVRDMVMDPVKKAAMKHEGFVDMDVGITLRMSLSESDTVAEHTHTVDLAPWEIAQIVIGHYRKKVTSVSNGHAHSLEITWDAMKERYKYLTCDGKPRSELCGDGHPKPMYEAEDI